MWQRYLNKLFSVKKRMSTHIVSAWILYRTGSHLSIVNLAPQQVRSCWIRLYQVGDLGKARNLYITIVWLNTTHNIAYRHLSYISLKIRLFTRCNMEINAYNRFFSVSKTYFLQDHLNHFKETFKISIHIRWHKMHLQNKMY